MSWESLESRLLLTVYTSYDAAAKKLTVDTSALGTSNDTIVVSLSAGNTLSVSVGGVNDFNLGSANLASVLTLINIQAGSGNDSINLGATTKAILTQTLMNGGNGADTITGGAGPDEIYGGNGNDSIDGGLGTDSISGGGDNDTISYATRATPVNVTLDGLANDGAAGENDNVGFGTTDIESIMGGAGNDTLVGNALGNYISGGAGADNMHGGDASDTLVGGAGSDSIYGDAGNDFIFAKDGEFDLIDGGADFDSAQVDSSPAEAPLPASMPAPSVQKPTSTFSTRRVGRTTPVPAPLPAGDVENTINTGSDEFPPILSPLDPYCVGQVLVTRDDAGNVSVGGTSNSDTFDIRSIPLAGSSLDITNNGGLTQFFLGTPSVVLQGDDADTLAVGGTPGNPSDATVLPDGQLQGAGMIAINGHNISMNSPTSQAIGVILLNHLDHLTYVTPNGEDQVTITADQTGTTWSINGQSDGVGLRPILFRDVDNVIIDTGTNDNAAGSNDTVTINGTPGTIGPKFTLLPGSIGVDTLEINGPVNLANDPFNPAGGATPTLNIILNDPSAHIVMTAPVVRLAGLNIQSGAVTLKAGGNKVLVVKTLDLGADGVLDIADNSLIVDYDQAPGTTAMVTGLIQNGYEAGAPSHWNGKGITSSIAAGDTSKGIGVAESGNLFPGGGTFFGVPVDSTATLVTFTLLGDSDLNRTVDFKDLVALAQHYGAAAGNWTTGDFNYDGTVDFADLVALAQNYGKVLA